MESLETLDLNQLEELIRRYPWFTLARREYFLRLSKMGTEYTEEGISKVALYLSTRTCLYKLLSASRKEARQTEYAPIPLNTDFSLPEPEPVPTQKPKIVVVGGDYFSREDFEQLNKTKGESSEPLKQITRQNTQKREAMAPLNLDDPGFFDEDFYTETLGKIYAEQGFSQRALEVYEKLILLYPEKSAYFAALIEEIKKHL